MANDSSENNNEVISLEGLDQELAPPPPGGDKASAPVVHQPTPDQLAEAAFQIIKLERDRDLSTDQIERVLSEEDSEFVKTIEDLAAHRSEPIPPDYNFNSDAIGLRLIAGKIYRLLTSPASIFGRYSASFSHAAQNYIESQKTRLENYFEYLKGGGYKTELKKLKDQIERIIFEVKRAYRSVRDIPRTRKLYFLLFLACLELSYVLTMKIIRNEKLPTFEIEGITSFAQVADQEFTYPDNAALEQFDSPIRHSDYVVLLGKIFANLRSTPQSSAQPMGAFRFHFEASSREAAMELVDREKEFLGIIQLVIQDMTWNELSTEDGKARLKLVLRKKMNETLNRGRVKKVLIETFVLKN